MAFTAGDVKKIEYTHEDFGSGVLHCKANEDATVDPGGFRSNDDDNQITSDGIMIDQMNRVRSFVELPPIAWDMTDADELNQLKKMAGSPKLADWTIIHVSGAVWAGRGKPVGDIQGATNTGQVEAKIAFEHELKQIA